jgi:hypothetical protein
MKRGRMPETGNPQTEAGVTRGFDREFPQPLNRQVGKTFQRLPQPLVIETGTTKQLAAVIAVGIDGPGDHQYRRG